VHGSLGLVCLTSSCFSSGLLFSVGVFASGFCYVCVCAWLGAFSFLWEREKKCVTNVKDVQVGKPVWRVPLFICI